MTHTQVAIIGAGPVGLFTAFYARLRGLDVTLIDSLSAVGGQVSHLYPQKELLDIPGFLTISGQKLVDQLAQQADQLNPHYYLGQQVDDVAFDATTGLFQLTLNQNFRLTADKVILAIGHGAFEPKRLPNQIGAAYEGSGVTYIANDLKQYTDKVVLVAGGGDSAVDQALALSKVAKHVYLTHRREHFRAMAYTLAQLEQTNVEILTPYNIVDIQQSDTPELAVVLEKSTDNTAKKIVVDDVVINYGFKSDSQFFETWTCQPQVERQRCLVDQHMQTTVPGLYAVGDIAGYANKTDLIAAGFGEAPLAVMNILQALMPDTAVPLHSSGFKITHGQLDALT